MANCKVTLKGITQALCGQNNLGGVKNIYLGNFVDFKTPKFVETDELGLKNVKIKLIEEMDTDMETLGFKKYELQPELSQIKTTVNKTAESAGKSFTTDLNLVFIGLDDEIYAELSNIIEGELVAVVEYNSGEVLYIGNDKPVKCSGGDFGSGVAFTDGKTFNINFQCISREMPRIVDTTHITDFK